MDERACHYCNTTERELRPYGPGGSWVCLPCVESDPERDAAAQGRFGALLDANAQIGGGVVQIGSEDGPQPFQLPCDTKTGVTP
jgi:hypothetical protein